MTENKFFQMLNNIDDELIAGAKQTSDPEAELYGDIKPLKLGEVPQSELYNNSKPTKMQLKRRPIWKSFAAAAACLMVIGAALGVGIAVNKQRNKLTVDPVSGVSDSINSNYPETAVYQYEGDFSELEPFSYAIADLSSTPQNLFELAYESDLIVVGTFVDDAWQDQPLTGNLYNRSEGGFSGHSYNSLRIDEVYKGNAVVGSEIVIGDYYYVYDGKLIYFAGYSSTPMIRGDRWVYFLKARANNVYYSTKAYCGRYLVPGDENTFALADKFSDRSGMWIIYPEVEKMLDKDPSALRMISIDYEGKSYNTVGYKDCDGVKLLVGTTKTKYEVGEYVEVIGVVQNDTDEQIALFKNNTGYDNQEIITSVYKDDLDLIDADTVDRMVSFGSSRYLISPGEIYYQPMRFSTYKEYDYNNHKFLDEYVPLGVYKCGSGIRLLRGDDEIHNATDGKHYSVGYEIEIVDSNAENTERDTLTYDGKTYNILRRGDYNGVKLIIGTTKDQYQAGDDVEVIAVVENNTDKPIGLWTPNGSHGRAHEEVITNLKNDDYYLIDASAAGMIVTCVESSYVLPSGATYYQPMRFGTYHERYSPEDTVIAEFVPLGKYKGTAGITLLSEPNNTSSHSEKYSVNFEVEVVNTHDSYEFTMEEFPGVSFKCDGETLTANGSELYRGTPIKNLYLIDLNGDGKRELCSTVYMEAQEEYRKVTDQRIMAYNYANGKLYELADRGQYDYRIEIEGGYEAPDNYQIYRVYAVKSKYSKYSTTDTYPIWRKELALDLMTEITEPNMKIKEFYKGVTEYKPGSTFYMGEFSLTRFDVSGSTIEMTRNGETTENLFTSNDHIEKVYLADLNSDGRREIIIESYTRPLKSPSMTLGEPEKMLTYLDIENETGVNLWPPKLHADISLTIDDGHLHILYEGKKDPTVLSTGRFDALAKSEGWDLDQWQEMY